jgi:hypothetical protein
MRIIAAFAFVFMLAPLARASDVDWKFFGMLDWKKIDTAYPFASGAAACLYDASTIGHESSGYLRVWAKCFAVEDLRHAMNTQSDLSDKAMDNADARLKTGYVPPIIVLGEMEFNDAQWVTEIEELADSGIAESRVQMLEELNCRERMTRILSIYFADGDKQKPTDWQYAPPEGNLAALLKLLCPVQ